MKRKWGKSLSILMAGALMMGSINMTLQAEDAQDSRIEITQQEMERLLAGDTNGGETVRTRQSVHDPSIVKADDGSYYVFGSHMDVAKTTDLLNWAKVASQTTDSTLFGNALGEAVSYNEAFLENVYQGKVQVTTSDGIIAEVDFGTYNIAKWISDNTVKGNMWAPDVIYNESLGKWCMYLSLNGDKWHSSIILLTADDIEGPYVYQAPIIFSGFSLADSSKSFHDTDLELVLGEMEELPEKYNQIAGDTSNYNSWGDWWPNVIDPNVFYDDDGNLWMVYGSWSGGIYLIELDEDTGMRDYTVTYESNSDTLGKNYTSDAYFGTRIAGGYYVSGEGPYIQKIGNYYYLFISYGGLDSVSGYNMRIFRSENLDGPYVDNEGTSAIFNSQVNNYNGKDNRGEKIMAAYKWDSMSVGELSQGHNSVLVDDDGKAYLIYHTRTSDGTEVHELRVHQLFINADGWPVAAPFEYDGESLSDGYGISNVAGEYDIIVHAYVQDYGNREYASPVQITLKEDGTVTGAYNGTWNISSSSADITLEMDGYTYKGTLIEQKVDGESYRAMCFTVVNEEGLCVWGAAVADDRYVIANNVKNFDFGVPERMYESVTLPTTGNGGAVISWTSAAPEVLSAGGELIGEVTEDTEVTLTATISKGQYFYRLEYPVVIKAGSGSYTERTLLASYFTDTPQDLSDKLEGSLSISNPFYKGTSPGLDISGGVSIEFDVVPNGEVNVLGTILGFTGGGKLYFTPGSYLGYNALGGYYDANLNDYKLVEDYIGSGARVTLLFRPDGFEVKMDGKIVYTEAIIGTESGAGTVVNYNSVLNWLYNSADTLYFGSGSWWDAKANCMISNVDFYVEPAAGDSGDVYYEKDEVILSTSSDITYESNPFYGKEIDVLYLEYTMKFADDAAKNGYDGIISFYNSSTTGRISVQTNPYLCYNAQSKWIDLNHPGNSESTNWAASAEYEQEYRITMLVTGETVEFTVDGEPIAVSVNGSGATYDDLLDFLSTCDKLTFGVGQGITSYWWTEICTITDIIISGTYDSEEPEIPVTGITIEGASMVTVKNGQTTTLTAAITPTDATNKAVTWSVSNSSIAEIDANGVITAKTAGMVVITATSADGGDSATVILKVSP